MVKEILIVDDDEDDRELFCGAVNELDHLVSCKMAHNGKEALDLLRSGAVKPDYIFLDLNMPKLNGKKFLSELKLDVALSEIPVVIYTTSKLPEDIEETKKLGAIHFITKPTGIEELCIEILYVLSKEWQKAYQ
jgi:CheY-like chemotaxis protein